MKAKTPDYILGAIILDKCKLYNFTIRSSHIALLLGIN